MKCKTGANYVVTIPKGNHQGKDKAFSCGRHLGETVRSAVEVALKHKVKVAYAAQPGMEECGWGPQ